MVCLMFSVCYMEERSPKQKPYSLFLQSDINKLLFVMAPSKGTEYIVTATVTATQLSSE